MTQERPSVDHYFMDMTHLVKARGTCPRRRVGAVIVKDKRVLTTGYNGAPRNFPHPIDVGCLRDELNIPHGMVADICPCLHAEQNAIIQAATTGVSIEGADLYCTTQPCTQCSRMVANCGIKRVIFEEEYPDPLAIGILTTSGVELWKWVAATNEVHRMQNTNTFEEAQDELRKRWRSGEMPTGGMRGLGVPSTQTASTRPIGALRKATPTHAAAPAAPSPSHTPFPGKTSRAPVEEPKMPEESHVRDLRNDPDREGLIRKLAREKAERKRRALEEATGGKQDL